MSSSRPQGEKFDVGDGRLFDKLEDIIKHYKENVLVETTGSEIQLKHVSLCAAARKNATCCS